MWSEISNENKEKTLTPVGSASWCRLVLTNCYIVDVTLFTAKFTLASSSCNHCWATASEWVFLYRYFLTTYITLDINYLLINYCSILFSDNRPYLPWHYYRTYLLLQLHSTYPSSVLYFGSTKGLINFWLMWPYFSLG